VTAKNPHLVSSISFEVCKTGGEDVNLMIFLEEDRGSEDICGAKQTVFGF
jgi:hypothetical protein